MKMKRDFILDLFFPNRCGFCGKVIVWDKDICEDCFEELELAEEVCAFCGKYPCACTNKNAYSEVFAACYYTDTAKDGVVFLKDGKNKNSATVFAEIIARGLLASEEKYDVITFVPMTKRKQRTRGYNQAEVIARALSEICGIPVESMLVKNFDNDAAQHTLSASERAENVKGMYSAAVKADGKRVLICDDVLTTGSTMNECAHALIAAGAKYVGVAVAATTRLEKGLEKNVV